MMTEAQLDFVETEEYDMPSDQASDKPKADASRKVCDNVLAIDAEDSVGASG